ncbi:hypothetical protein, partial [Pantoea sp. Haah2121]|uniref:hypothetical protein n=1 Tax=Pantoea sp. Haah2121 TaxID=3109350 RepID=UPI002FFF0929
FKALFSFLLLRDFLRFRVELLFPAISDFKQSAGSGSTGLSQRRKIAIHGRLSAGDYAPHP